MEDVAQAELFTVACCLHVQPGGTVAHQYSTLGGYPCFDRQPDLQAVSNVHRPAALPNTESHTASMPSVITSEVSIPRPTAAHKPGVDVQRPLSAVHKVHNQGDDYAREAAEGYSVGNASHRQQAVRLQHRQQPSSSIETADQTDMESCQSIPARLSAARAAQDASVSQHEDQLGRDELFQGSANMQQGDIGVQQGNTGLQQSSVGLRQGSTGQQQDNTGLQQDNIGLQQGSTGPQQGSTGLQQGNAGLQYGSTGPQQGSTGLSQGNTSWQQGITGLQQGNIDLWPNLRACSEHAGTSRSYTMPAASKIQQDAGQANARCCSLEQACSVQNSGSQADPVPAGTSKTHGAECHSLDSVSLQPVKSQPKSASADTSSSKQWSQPCSGEMHSIHQSGKPEDCCSAADAYELLQAHQLQVTPQPTCGEDNRSDMHSASSTAFHMQQKLWCTGRALSAASSASDSEEGTPTPSGRDSILETQQQWCLPSGTQHDNDADALGQHQNGADSQLINASHVLCSSEVEIKAMWRCPQQQEPSEKKQSASGLYSR